MDQQSPTTNQDSEYPNLPMKHFTPRHKRSLLLKIVAVLAAAAIITIILLLVDRHKAAAPTKTTESTKTTQSSAGANSTHIDSTTKRYDSTNLFLGFDYPADWSVSDPGSGKLTVISPPLWLKSGNGNEQARIVMTIQTPQTTISQFAANTAVAPIASQKLTYKKPTPGQRAQTYLTAVNYAGGNSTIDAFYITGDNGYTAAQYVPQGDVIKDNPLISISFFACADASCSNYGKPTNIAPNAWADTDLSGPLIAMLESLVID